VLSFGMLAIVGFQSTLLRSSDLAKQRAEALRLAQQKMETLRSFGQVATDPTVGAGHKFNFTDDVVSSTTPEVFTSNANFSRTWTVTPNATGTEKWVNVVVEWTDRAGQTQRTTLQSTIAKFDPQSIGVLATGPGGTNVRKPKNRNLNIPYPALGLSGGTKSAFSPPPGGVTYVFNNVSGDIVQSCTGLAATPAVAISTVSNATTVVTVTATGHTFRVGNRVTIAGVANAAFNGTFAVTAVSGSTFTYTLASPPANTTSSGGTATLVVTQLVEGFDLDAAIAAGNGVVCQAEAAYLLSGYVRFDTANGPTGEEPNNPGTRNDTKALAVNSPLSLDTSNQSTTNGTPSMVCYAQRQRVVSISNPATIAITGLSRSGSTVTVTTVAAHGFSAGQTVAINATSSIVFAGAFVVATVPTTTTFTYTLPAPLPTATSATGGTAQLLQRLTIAEGTSVTGYSNVDAKFVSYACVVTPVNHDLSASTPLRWWGRVTLNTDGSWVIGNSNGQFKVCRYSADYNGNGAIANAEHPQWYRGVTGALDSQNYLVIDQAQSCPTEVTANPFSNQKADYSDDTTALHQPYSAPGVFSFQCLTAACTGGNRATREPTTTSTDLFMD
jgi:Tfp pilus assembly protein PilV